MKKFGKKCWLLTLAMLISCFVLFAGFGCGYVYESTKYTVTFMNGDDVFSSKEYSYGDNAEFPEEEPEKEADDENSYTFVGWNYTGDPSEELVTAYQVQESVTFHAVYMAEKIGGEQTEYLVTFRDSVTGMLIPEASQYVREGGTAKYPAIPDHTDEHWTPAEQPWSEPEGTIITSRMEIVALYTRTVYPVYAHYLDKVAEVGAFAYGSNIRLSDGVPNLDPAFRFEGWYEDAGYSELLGTPEVSEENLTQETVDGKAVTGVFVYAKYGLNVGADNPRLRVQGILTYGGEAYASVPNLTHPEGLEYSYHWNVTLDGEEMTSEEETFALRNAGSYLLTCVVTADYLDGSLTATKMFGWYGNGEEADEIVPVTVDKANLFVSVGLSTNSVIYGNGAPESVISFEGLKYDDEEELDVPITFTYTNEKHASYEWQWGAEEPAKLPVGNYTMRTKVGELRNYKVYSAENKTEFDPLAFSVTKKPLTVRFTVPDYTYGEGFAPVHAFEGFAYGESAAVLGEHWFAIDGGETHHVEGDRINAGRHRAKLFGYASENYDVRLPSAEEAFSVAKRSGSVVLHAQGGVYGVTPEFTYTFDNVLEDDYETFTPTYSYKRNGYEYARENFIVGKYDLAATFAESANNYNTLTVTGTQFEITKKPLEVSVSVKDSYVYGEDVVPEIVYEDAFAFDETAQTSGVIQGTASYVYRTASDGQQYIRSRKVVDSYTVEVSGISADNYEFSFPKSSFTVTKKALTLTVHLSAESILYGVRPTPATGNGYTNGISYEGLLPDEPVAAVFGGEPTIVYLNGEGSETRDFHAGSYTATVKVDPRNYQVSVEEAKLTVNKRTLYVGISLRNSSLAYGSKPTNATVVYENEGYNGFYANERELFTKAVDIRYTGDETYTLSALKESSVKMVAGQYTLSVIGLDDGVLADYEVTYQDALSFSITPKELKVTLTANSTQYTYGDAPSVQVDFSGFVYDENKAIFGAHATDVLFVTAGKKLHASDEGHIGAGDYTATLEGIENANYHVTLNAASFKVNKKGLTVTVSADGFTYGDKQTPVPTLSYNGFLLDEDASVLGGEAVYAYEREGEAYSGNFFDAGSYTVAVSGLTSDNYAITTQEGSFTVSKRTATVTLTATGATYGGTPTYGYEQKNILERDLESFGFGYSLTFSRPNDNRYSAYTPTDYTYYQAGNYRVTLEFTQNKNYNDVRVSAQNFTVEQKPLTIGVTGINTSYTYGDKLTPVLTFEGFVDGENEENAFSSQPATPFSYSISESGSINGEKFAVGNYFIAATNGYRADNYQIDYAEKIAFAVTQKALTVTVTVPDITYGEEPVPKLAFDGFVYEEGEADLSGSPKYAYTGDKSTSGYYRAGTHDVSVSGYDSANYKITFVGDSFNVAKRPLTVTVTVEDITYGDDPDPDVTCVGFISDENESNLEGELTYNYTGETSTSGHYRAGQHTLELGGYTSSDYAITFEGASFNVTPREVTVTFAAPWTTYADDEEGFVWYTVSDNILEKELTFASSFTREGSVYTLGSDPYLPHGEYVLTLTYTPNPDYTVKKDGNLLSGTATKDFSIAKRTLTVSFEGQEPWAKRETWEGEPKLSDNRFTLEGQFVLSNAAGVTAQAYTDTTIGETFKWKNGYKIMRDGKDVTENFDLTYSIALTLKNSHFSFTMPTAAETSLTYDHVKHQFEIKNVEAEGVDASKIEITYKTDEQGEYEKTVPSFIDAGEYTVYYKVSAPNCDPEEGKFTVKIAQATPVLKTVSDSTSYVYNKSAQIDADTVKNAVITGESHVYDDAIVEYKITFNEAEGGFESTLGDVKNAGAYTITVKVSGSNYNDATGTYSLTVGKATVESPEIKHATYKKGETQTAEVATSELYTVQKNNGGVDASNYDVVLKLNDASNYKWAAGEGETITLTFTIDKAQLTKPTADETSFTYDSTEKTYNPKGFDPNTMSVKDNVQTTAGGHSVTVSITDQTNYKWTDGNSEETVTFTFTIAKADYRLDNVTSATGYTYNAAPQGRTLDELKALIEVFGSDEFTVAFVGAGTSTNAGDTLVKYKVSGNPNYNDATGSYTVTIAKATLTLKDAATKAVDEAYNTKNHFKAITKEMVGVKITEGMVGELYDGDSITVTYSTTYNEKGDGYDDALTLVNVAQSGTVYFLVTAGSNYEEVSGSYEVKIAKADYVVTVGNQTFTYNGKAQGNPITVNGVSGDTSFEAPAVTYNDSDAVAKYKDYQDGGYPVSYTVEAGANYNGKSGSYTITINKATLTLKDKYANCSYQGFPFENGAFFTVTGEKNNESGETVYTVAITRDEKPTTEIKNAGNYAITLTAGTNYTFGGEATINFTIAQADYVMDNVKWNYTKPFTYDGSLHTVVLSALPQKLSTDTEGKAVTASYVGNTQTNAKKYSASVTFEYDTVNYNEPKVDDLAWDIDKATPDITQSETQNLKYNGSNFSDTVAKSIEINNVYGGEVVKYQINGEGDFSDTLGEIKNAGTYTITVMVSGDNYVETTKEFTVTVAKAQLTLKAGYQNTLKVEETYNKTNHFKEITKETGIVDGLYGDDSITVQYSKTQSNYGAPFDLINVKDISESGTGTVYFKVTAGENYEEVYGSYTVTIDKATTIKVNQLPITEEYKPEVKHAVALVKGENVTGLCDGDTFTVTYSTTQTGDYTQELPSKINVKDSGDVWYKIDAGSNYEEVTGYYHVEITPAKLDKLPDGVLPTIGEQVNELGKTLEDVKLPDGFSWSDGDSLLYIEAHDYVAVYTDPSENYQPKEVTITFSTRRTQVTVEFIDTEIKKEYQAQLLDQYFEDVVSYDCALEAGLEYGDGEENYIKGLINASYSIGSYSKDSNGYPYGGTYLLQVTFTYDEEDNYYEFIGEGKGGGSRVFKICSVQAGSTWCTIEDALASTEKSITVKYNTAFAEKTVADKAGYSVAGGHYTVKSGVTLLLPYDGGSGLNQAVTGGTGSALGDANKKKVELIIGENIILTNNGTINVGGETTGAQAFAGGTSGNHGQITLGKNAKIDSYGDINAYGFITEETEGNGSQVVMNKGTLLMPFIVVEHRGGTIFSNMAGGVKHLLMGGEPNLQCSPFNQFYLQNITAFLTIKSNAALHGWANLYAGSQDNTTTINLVSASGGSLIQLTEGAYLTAKYSIPSKITELNIYGDAIMNALTLTIKVVVSFTLSTEEVFFPISWMFHITLNPLYDGRETNVNVPTQKLKMLPGSKLTVNKGVNLNVDQLIIYDNTFIDVAVGKGPYPSGKGDAILTVNGTINAKTLAGKVTAGSDGAKLNITTGNKLDSKEINSDAPAYQTITKTLTLQLLTLSSSSVSDWTERGVGSYIAKSGAWVVPETQLNMTYHFVFRNKEGESVEQSSSPVHTNPSRYSPADILTLMPAECDGWVFIGWFSADDCIDKITTIDGSLLNLNTTVYGLFEQIDASELYTIRYNANGGVFDINGEKQNEYASNPARFDDLSLLEQVPERTGYTFMGWYLDMQGTGEKIDSIEKLNEENFTENVVTVYAKWQVDKYDLTISVGENTTLTINGIQYKAGTNTTLSFEFGTQITIQSDASRGYEAVTTPIPSDLNWESFTMPAQNVTITTSAKETDPCLVEGTLVMLADGTQKPVEDLTYEDQLLVFNHDTGKYEANTLRFMIHAGEEISERTVLTLTFSNGRVLRIAQYHGLFDRTLKKYIFIDAQNYEEFIGHEFSSVSVVNDEYIDEKVVLESVTLSREMVRVYSPISNGQMNVVAEGMLTMTPVPLPSGNEFMVNFFEYDDDMKYNEAKKQADIEKYGLLTLEEVKDMFPEGEWDKAPHQYLKVAIGKGLITMEDIQWVIQYLFDNSYLE